MYEAIFIIAWILTLRRMLDHLRRMAAQRHLGRRVLLPPRLPTLLRSAALARGETPILPARRRLRSPRPRRNDQVRDGRLTVRRAPATPKGKDVRMGRAIRPVSRSFAKTGRVGHPTRQWQQLYGSVSTFGAIIPPRVCDVLNRKCAVSEKLTCPPTMAFSQKFSHLLPVLACPSCGSDVTQSTGELKRAGRYSDCLRRCKRCGIGFSNARHSATRIYQDPEMNVPEQSRGGIAERLKLALNERNRPSKRIKFGFSTSEDALTWTVFTYLNMTGQLRAARKPRSYDASSNTACRLPGGRQIRFSRDGKHSIGANGICRRLRETGSS